MGCHCDNCPLSMADCYELIEVAREHRERKLNNEIPSTKRKSLSKSNSKNRRRNRE